MNVSDTNDGLGAPEHSDGRDPSGEQVGAMDSTEQSERLAEAEAKAQEYLDGWQRERAAFANYRRRLEQERGGLAHSITADVVCQLLPVLDDLRRACDNVPDDIAEHPWAAGVCLTLQKFEQTLERLGVEPIEIEGCRFDPQLHEALTHEEAEGFGEGEIIGEILRGFRMGDRVLRCSVVRVAKGQSDRR